MGKTVLVMDMPVMCGTCPCFGENEETYKHYCRTSPSPDDNTVSFYEKPDWCPLIPMPDKKDPFANFDGAIDIGTYQYAEAEGWNACLDTLNEKNG